MTARRSIAAGTVYGDALAYSRAVVVGDDAWIAGCAPFDAGGAVVGPGDAEAQTRQCLENISHALSAAGFSIHEVVRTRIYLRSFADADAVMAAHREVFHAIRPACTVIAVADLVQPEMLVYVDADARRSRQVAAPAPDRSGASGGDPLARFQPGDEIGLSEWALVTQSMIDAFGAVTLDPDPMHVDPAWADANGPFGGTIAFGFLTLSLLTAMFHQAVGTRADNPAPGEGFFLNYGFDRVRMVAPVRQGRRIRARFALSDRKGEPGSRVRYELDVQVEIEDEDRPALVATWLAMWTPHEGSPASGARP